MEKRKIIIFSIVLVVLGAAIFFGIRFIEPKKVTVSAPSISDGNVVVTASPADESVLPEGRLIEKPVENNSEEVVTQDSKADEKVATEENKVVEKTQEKTVETEKPTEVKNQTGKIVQKLMSSGFQKASGRKIDTIIVHSSYDALGSDPYSVSGIIAEYKQYGVSAHYLIARDGVIYQLVQDKDIAWHAGVSKVPDGRTNTNDFSLGIEMINTKDGKYTSEQYAALNGLISDLKKSYTIKYILGHNEIAPGRKTDPWNINWDNVKR